MTGILLIALGDKYYMQLALNLAVSIKINTPDTLVCLVHDGGYDKLSDKHKVYFDSAQFVTNNSPFSVKTLLYDLTPFDKTLYLDVDTIILPGVNLQGFIQSLAGSDFSVINTLHNKDMNIWANADQIRALTGNYVSPFYHYFSELMYFEKSDKMQEYFNAVKAFYNNPGVESRTIAKQVPDELAFIMASMKLDIYPHKADWYPLFWYFRNKKDTALQMFQLSKKYIGYSIGGNALPEYVKATYDNIVAFYERKTGLKGLRKSVDKRLIFRDRIKI